jgi:hypothetical protein
MFFGMGLSKIDLNFRKLAINLHDNVNIFGLQIPGHFIFNLLL